MAITALLDLRVKPENLSNARAILHEVLTATRAFDGSLGVDVVIDLDDPTHFVVIEKWASVEADTAYRVWRSTPEGRSDLGSILAGPPALVKGTVVDDI